MSKSKKPHDPFAAREAEKYANPIPSREFILEHLKQVGKPVSYEKLCHKLNLTDEDTMEALRRRLIAMRRDGQLMSNRRGVYGLAEAMDLIKGRIQGNKDGFGFFIPDDGFEDLFLNGREMEKLFDGDRVLARLSGYDSRGRREGTIVEILQRRYEQVVGRFYREQGFGIVVPDSKRITHEILIPDSQAGKAEDGQFVVAEITEYPSKRRKAIAKVVEILGDITTPGLEIDVAVRSHDIPHVWSGEVEKETGTFSESVSKQDLTGRKDLRKLPFVTIDGEDAKDFDDAVYARVNPNGGWTLHVAIADVSHYVKIGSELDFEAQNRATSVYFPGSVIPMLPEKLSNGLCSLKPEVDRLTMVCEMEISAQGETTSFKFYEGVIHSHARLTYTEVADMVQTVESPVEETMRDKMRERYSSVVADLDNLHDLYKAIKALRERNGATDFDSIETRIVFGENKKIREIVPVQRNDAHRLIEECMLCANVSAARLLEDAELPTLYRVHEGPNPDKLENLREFLSEMGLHLPGGDKPSPGDYQHVIKQMADRPDRHLLQTVMIRSLMQAVYQPDNLGHFGLGFQAYAHFTSPIRRYPDLLVHRGIRYLIRNKKNKHIERQSDAPELKKGDIYPYGLGEMEQFGSICSVAERRADAAGYDVMDALKCEYMKDRVGDEFTGTVSSVTSFGLFVELNDIYIEGLVHITELSNDYYHFDPVRHCLEGERKNTVYRLGDTVEVRVVRVDQEDKKIDLQMVGLRDSRGKPSGSKGKSKNYKKDKHGKKDKHSKTASKKKHHEKNKEKNKAKGENSDEGGNKGGLKPRKKTRKKSAALKKKAGRRNNKSKNVAKKKGRRGGKPNAKPRS